MDLTAENVHACFTGSLFDNNVDKAVIEATSIKTSGITRNVGFDPDKIMTFKEDVKSMILQIPDIKDGISFLCMCINTDGHQWGEHINVEELVLLGQALELLEPCVPRDMWYIFPGGMPYYQLKNAS